MKLMTGFPRAQYDCTDQYEGTLVSDWLWEIVKVTGMIHSYVGNAESDEVSNDRDSSLTLDQ